MRVLLLCCLFLVPIIFQAQEVTVSGDISLRDKEAYDIVGRVDDAIILFNHEGKEQSISIYNENLVLQSERQINLIGKRPRIYEVLNLDTAFAVIYGYHDKKEEVIQLDIFSATAELLDSIPIASRTEDWTGLDFESVFSEDGSFLSLYQLQGNNELHVMTYDLSEDSLYRNFEYKFGDVNLYDVFLDAQISNKGDFYMLMEINNSKSQRDKHEALIYHFPLNTEAIQQIVIPLREIVCADLVLAIDNRNGKVGVGGLYDEKRKSESEGFFWIAEKEKAYDNLNVSFFPFNEELLFEVYGNRKEKRLDDFAIADVIWKKDGSPILVFEMQVDVSRRTSNGFGGSVNSRTAVNSWSDHYREDLILISLNLKNEVEWHRVFYKRQFSQNDGAIFSSFYSFLTPQRLRLIYNDEIKTNSTVSEYILDPLGNYKRTSVLSTEYQNLRLRFADAEQISSTELLIPSQKNYTLNMVKIDFGI